MVQRQSLIEKESGKNKSKLFKQEKEKVEWFHTEFFFFPFMIYHFSDHNRLEAKEQAGLLKYLIIYGLGLMAFLLVAYFLESAKRGISLSFILKIVLAFELFFFLVAQVYLYKIDQEVRRKFNWYKKSKLLS